MSPARLGFRPNGAALLTRHRSDRPVNDHVVNLTEWPLWVKRTKYRPFYETATSSLVPQSVPDTKYNDENDQPERDAGSFRLGSRFQDACRLTAVRRYWYTF